MENGGNDKHWRRQTSNNNNNNNVWWDLAHLGLGEEEEEEMGTSQPFDCWTKRSNVGVVINSQDYGHHHHQLEEEEVMMMNPPTSIISITNTNGGVSKQYHSSSSLYAPGGSHVYPDPHLTCLRLKLGNTKRRQYYFEDGTSNIISAITTTTTDPALGKKGKSCTTGDGDGDGVSLLRVGFGVAGGGGGGGVGSSSTVVIPRCQVDGCHVELLCAREYHRRHKVCEVHSKATKVEVLGIEQRFCQQCSRFHVITEFDDSKRSCRRRLAGHNERRRKMSSSSSSSSSTSSSNDSTTTTSITSTSRKCFDRGGGGGLPHTKIPSSPRVCNAPSLLSTSGVSLSVDLLPSGVALHDPSAEKCVNIVHRQYSSSTTNWPKH